MTYLVSLGAFGAFLWWGYRQVFPRRPLLWTADDLRQMSLDWRKAQR